MEMWGFDSTTFEPKRLKATSNALHMYLAAALAAERNPNSATNGYFATYTPCNVTCCDGTSAVTIGGGVAGDTHLLGITIVATAGPPTATITGFGKATNSLGSYTAKSLVITGSTSADIHFFPPGGLINDVGALTVTGSVDEVVWVYWRAI